MSLVIELVLLTTPANTWATTNGADAQRLDLWKLNLAQPLEEINSWPDAVFDSLELKKQNLPPVQEAHFYAAKVSLPVLRTEHLRVIQGTSWRYLPRYVEALDTVRIEFLHDTAARLSTFISAWLAYTRTGRVNQYRPHLLLAASSSKPQFKFDLALELLAGSADGTSLTPTVTYQLRGAWPRASQLDAVDLGAKAQALNYSVQFNVDEII